MKKNILLSTLLILTFILGASILAPESVFAGKDIRTSGEGRRDADNVDARFLNQEEPILLPTSPFYFLKELKRGIRMLFTFNPIKKSELEIKINDEKMAELVAVVEKEPQNEKAIQKALVNYQKSRERLAQRLNSLKITSENPNIDRLIDKIFEHEVKHIEVFDQVSQISGNKDKFKGGNHVTLLKRMASQASSEESKIKPGPNQGGHVTLLKRMASQGVSERIAKTIKSTIEQLPEGELKSLRGMEIIDRLSEDLAPEVAGELMKVREEYSEKLVDEINKISESKGEEVKPEIISTIKSLPGDPVKHLMILEEVERNANLREIEKKDIRRGMVIATPGVISSAKEALIEEISSQQDIKQKSEEQIKRAEEAIKKLEESLSEESSENLRIAPTASNLTIKTKSSPPRLPSPESQSLQTLLEQAKEHLGKAKKAFEEGKYGEAFGLAVSAQSLAENGLRILLVSQVSSSVPSAQQVPSPVEPPKQACPTIAPACPLENCLKAGKELETKYPGCNYTSVCEKQCQIEECGPMPAYPTKEGCQRVCKDGKWEDVCESNENTSSSTESCGKIRCFRYDPVCGTDGKTYACGAPDALACGVKVAYTGECKNNIEEKNSERIRQMNELRGIEKKDI